MTDPLQLFPAHAPIGRTPDGKTVYMTTEFFKALKKVFDRVGGATGPSTTDLNISDDEDSGLEEFRLEQWKHNDAADMAPPVVLLAAASSAPDDAMNPIRQEHVTVEALQTELAGLRSEVARLQTQFEDLMRGMSL